MVVTYIYAAYMPDQTRVQIRCRNLADAINRTGVHHANLLEMNSFVQNSSAAQEVCAGSDLLVIYRYLYGSILTAIQYWQARGKKVIVDFDQAVNYLTDSMRPYSFWFDGTPLTGFANEGNSAITPPPIEQFKWGLKLVDAATVSSARLANDWSRFTQAYEIADYVNTSHYPGLNQFHENEIWVGLGNQVSYDSFERSGLRSAIENICNAHAQIKLVLYGMEAEARRLNIQPEQLIVFHPCGFDEWVNVLLKLNLGLVPTYGDHDLRLGSYDLLEFMIAKIPWIASTKSPFHELSQYGQWVCNTTAAWEDTILQTTAHLETHQKEAEREPFIFALSQDLSMNINKILNIYHAIINQ